MIYEEKKIPDGPVAGGERYPDYAALWHLQSLGVMDALLEDGAADRAKTRERPVRVAVIDTSVAMDHPCLKDAINTRLAIDFFSARLGSFPALKKRDKIDLGPLQTETRVAEGLDACTALLAELTDRLSARSAAWHDGVAPTASRDFSNHGTAIAGLVGARPVVVDVPVNESVDREVLARVPLPYSGADPFCEIVPVSTNFDTDPESLALAFLYAELIEADVILVPRSIPDPARIGPELGQELLDGASLLNLCLPCVPSPEEAALWEELARLIDRISLRRPIVCAAGNNREVQGIYPANLASDHNGVISVGAVNAKGILASYTATGDLTIMGPSADGESFDAGSVRLDAQSGRYTGEGVPEQNDNGDFSSLEIITTDVPGRHGYSSSPFFTADPPDVLREFGSYFCKFGGTSAASAIVAGFISLGFSLGRIAAGSDGPAVKAWLQAHSLKISSDTGDYRYPVWNGHVNFPDLSGV